MRKINGPCTVLQKHTQGLVSVWRKMAIFMTVQSRRSFLALDFWVVTWHFLDKFKSFTRELCHVHCIHVNQTIFFKIWFFDTGKKVQIMDFKVHLCIAFFLAAQNNCHTERDFGILWFVLLKIRQSTIYYAGLLGRWDKQIVNQESDVQSSIFLSFS